jgi:hypothetical protein
VVDPGWRVLLRDIGIEPQDLLRHARLPLGLFARSAPTLTTEQYFRLWDSLEQLLGDPPDEEMAPFTATRLILFARSGLT